MHRINFGMFALVLLSLFWVSHAASAYEPCVKTAWQMLGACKLDVREEHKETVANCLNISNRQAQHQCFVGARKAVPEEVESCLDQFEARVDVCDLLGEYRYDPDPLVDPTINFVDVD